MNELSRDDVTELKNYNDPSEIVKNVVKCVMIYLEYTKQDWPTGKKMMSDMKFLEKLKEYDKENIKQNILTKVSKIVLEPDFNPAIIKEKSRAAGGLAKWCKSVREYYLAVKVVKPKQARLAEMTEKFNQAMAEVDQKKKEL